jgi:hypothetical protein
LKFASKREEGSFVGDCSYVVCQVYSFCRKFASLLLGCKNYWSCGGEGFIGKGISTFQASDGLIMGYWNAPLMFAILIGIATFHTMIDRLIYKLLERTFL